MVTAMGGQLTKASSDVSFVIVKDVLAQKYKVFFQLFIFIAKELYEPFMYLVYEPSLISS